MRPGGTARRSNDADLLPAVHLFARLHAERLQVAVARLESEAVIEDERIVGWLFGIATNLARNRQRSLWRARRLLGQLVSSPSAASPENDAAARAEAREQVRALFERVRRLPREQQDVIALCLWSGLTYEEAAVALSVPVGTVRSRLSRARARVRELSSAHGHEPDCEPGVPAQEA